MASAANIAIPVQDMDMLARCGPTEAIRPRDAAGDKLSFTEPCGQPPDDHDGQTSRRRQVRFGDAEIEKAGERADNGALQSRPLATLAVGHPTRISPSEHRSQELDPDGV
jgi:hypothetical protein